MPIGIARELVLGGAGLALGYHNRPDLTSERFLTSSMQTGTAQRLDRTGDRARFLEDGNIEFLGRRDRQLKLRGYRIEPGEIEAALRTHPLIHDCVVDMFSHQTRGYEHVAWVVAQAGVMLTAEQLKEHVGSCLADAAGPVGDLRGYESV